MEGQSSLLDFWSNAGAGGGGAMAQADGAPPAAEHPAAGGAPGRGSPGAAMAGAGKGAAATGSTGAAEMAPPAEGGGEARNAAVGGELGGAGPRPRAGDAACSGDESAAEEDGARPARKRARGSTPPPEVPELDMPHSMLCPLPGVSPAVHTHWCGLGDRWNAAHVAMPCSPRRDGGEGRWSAIREALSRPMSGPGDLQRAVLECNPDRVRAWRFTALHALAASPHASELSRRFFGAVLPRVAALALELPALFPGPVPLLRRGERGAVTMSRRQAACLLANALFCTFPKPTGAVRHLCFHSLYSISGRANRAKWAPRRAHAWLPPPPTAAPQAALPDGVL